MKEEALKYPFAKKWKYKRIRTPTIIQMEATECGAVSLMIIMAYFGKYITNEEARIQCGISRNGSNALNIINAATNNGFEAHGYSFEMDEVDDLVLPAIAFWNFNHFIVIEGFCKDGVFINDPATGPRKVSLDEFDKSFTGLVIELEKTKDFVKSGKAPSVIKPIISRLREVKKTIFFTLLAGIALIIPNLAFPAFTQVFVDQIIINNFFSWKTGIIIGLTFIMILHTLFTYIKGFVLNRLGVFLSMKYDSEMLWHILHLPMSYYTQRFPGEVASRMTLNENVTRTLTGTVATSFLDITLIIIYGLVMLYYDVIITLVGILSVLLNIILIRSVFRSRMDAYANIQSDEGKSMGFSISALENMETIKASGTEYKIFPQWAGYYTKVINNYQKIGKRNVALGILPPFFDSITNIVLLGVGAWRIMNGAITIGMFLALRILLEYFTTPVMTLASSIQQVQLLKIDISRLDDVLQNPIDSSLLITEKSKVKENEAKLKGYIEFHNVSFSYGPMDPLVLKNIYLSLNPGKSIALVGSTGCGKSSISRIIAGLYKQNSGEVLFDGIPREKLSREKIVNSLAIIEQEPFLFHGTVKENLTMMDTLIPEEEIIRACKDANIHEEILSRKGGYETILQEGGGNLSGGQRQRLEIARSLIKNPTIIIMDEATSALDSESSSIVVQNIARRGCSILMIAHRLSTIKDCDAIYVMDNGNIIASGTHEELITIPGIYRDLIESEQRGYV